MSWKSRTVLATTSPPVVAGAGVTTIGTTTAWHRDEAPSAGASPSHEPEVTSGYQSEHGSESGDNSHEGTTTTVATMTDLARAGRRVAGLALVPLSAGQTVGNEALLRPGEVAALFRVDPKTVSRWAKAGKLSTVRTLGGHRRFREAEIRALVAQPPKAIPVVPVPGHQAS